MKCAGSKMEALEKLIVNCILGDHHILLLFVECMIRSLLPKLLMIYEKFIEFRQSVKFKEMCGAKFNTF